MFVNAGSLKDWPKNWGFKEKGDRHLILVPVPFFYDKMKKYMKTFILLFFIIVTTSCGSSTPPADIPTPVSHLSISSPNTDGNIRVAGEAGATDAGATVTIVNVTRNTTLIKNLISAVTSQTLTSNTDGSFSGEVEGETGDTIEVTVISDGSVTTVSLTVPDNVPQLALTSDILDISYYAANNELVIAANDGTDGFLYYFSLDTLAITDMVTFLGASGLSRVSVNNNSDITMALDTANNLAHHHHIILDNQPSDGIPSSSDLVAGLSENYAIIAHTNSATAMSYYDLNLDAATTTGTSQTEGGTNQSTSLFIAIDNDGTNDIVVLLSQMPDSLYYLTTHRVDFATPALVQTAVTQLTNLSTPEGLVFFNNATEALVTDSDNNVVLRVNISAGTITEITVGDNPQGVAVNGAEDTAYVVNNRDRTVSIISLDGNTVTSTQETGLSPTEIVFDPGMSLAVTLNTGDETLTILD